MRTNARELLDALRAMPIVRNWPGPSADSLLQAIVYALHGIAPVLVALARVESNFDTDAIGDDGASTGLWQLHEAYWPGRPDVPSSIEVQAAYVMTNNIPQVLAHVERAVRSRAARGISPDMPKPETIAVWISIIWQYGGGSFSQWIDDSGDHTAIGFKAYRDSISRPVLKDFDRRQKLVRSEYSAAVKRKKKQDQANPDPDPRPRGPLAGLQDRLDQLKDDTQSTLLLVAIIVAGVVLLKR